MEKKSKTADTAPRILAVATKLFAAQGYDGTSTKQICDEADVNIAAIHYHFGSKEELYAKIIRDFGEARAFNLERILRKPENFTEFALILRLVMSETIESYMSTRDVARIVMREAEVGRAFCCAVFEKTFVKSHLLFVEFFKDAKSRGIIGANVDPEIAAEHIFGLIHMRLLTGEAFPNRYLGDLADLGVRERLIATTLAITLEGMRPR